MLCKGFKIHFCRILTLKHFNRVPDHMQSDLLDYLDYRTLALSLNWAIFIFIALLAHYWLCWLTCWLILLEIYTKVTELPELVKVFDCPIWILEKNSCSGIDTLVTHIYTVVGHPSFRFKLTGSAQSWYTSPPGGGKSPVKLTGMPVVPFRGLNWWIGTA